MALRPRFRRRAAAAGVAAALAALALGACSDDSTVRPAATTSAAENAPGGAGDEQAARVPAAFAIDGPRLSPPRVQVPAFLAIELTFSSADGKAHHVVLRSPARTTLDVPPGGRRSRRVEGLRAGRYAVVVDGSSTDGSLVVGGEPGP